MITTSNNCGNIYKSCRATAGKTQEHAAELIGVSTRTLSDYENGHANVPEDIVESMIEIYNTPSLAIQHMKQTSALGKYLPDIIMPQTNGDMAFQLILAQDDLKPVVDEIKRIMSDGKVCETEQGDFDQSIELVKKVNAKLLSVIIYAGGKQ